MYTILLFSNFTENWRKKIPYSRHNHWCHDSQLITLHTLWFCSCLMSHIHLAYWGWAIYFSQNWPWDQAISDHIDYGYRPCHTMRCCKPAMVHPAMHQSCIRCSAMHVGNIASNFGISQLLIIWFSNSFQGNNGDIINVYVNVIFQIVIAVINIAGEYKNIQPWVADLPHCRDFWETPAMVCDASRCIKTAGKCLILLHRVAGPFSPKIGWLDNGCRLTVTVDRWPILNMFDICPPVNREIKHWPLSITELVKWVWAFTMLVIISPRGKTSQQW